MLWLFQEPDLLFKLCLSSGVQAVKRVLQEARWDTASPRKQQPNWGWIQELQSELLSLMLTPEALVLYSELVLSSQSSVDLYLWTVKTEDAHSLCYTNILDLKFDIKFNVTVVL